MGMQVCSSSSIRIKYFSIVGCCTTLPSSHMARFVLILLIQTLLDQLNCVVSVLRGFSSSVYVYCWTKAGGGFFYIVGDFVIEAETLAENNCIIIPICTNFLLPQSLTITNSRTIRFNIIIHGIKSINEFLEVINFSSTFVELYLHLGQPLAIFFFCSVWEV